MRKDDLILVIDMQNVYEKGEPWACLDTDGAAENIVRILDRVPKDQVVFTRFLPPEHPEGAWKVYNETYRDINEDAYLNDMIPRLKERSEGYRMIDKSTYSSLRDPELCGRAKRAGRLVLTGVVAECCVLATAFDAIDLGCHVMYLTDAVSGFDKPKEEGTVLTLSGLSPVHTSLMTTEEYLTEDR